MKNKSLNLICFGLIVSVFFLASCDKPSYELKEGIWRGALLTEAGIEIPFNFEVKDSLGHHYIDIVNGQSKLRVNDIRIEKDSVYIQLPFFDAELRGALLDGHVDGVYIKHLPDKEVSMAFSANYNVAWRIKEQVASPKYDISGKWETYFIKDNGDSVKAIGDFKQEGSRVTGTFMTRTGDYRFLDGVLDGDKLSLSTFDGGFAMFFSALLTNDSTMVNGEQYSGFSSQRKFFAKKNDKVVLDDPYSLTYLKPGYKKIEFSFPDVNKQQVSLRDARFKDKVVVVQILGSWCPNCIDETAFLSQYYKKQNGDVEIVGLAYEATKDFEKSKANIQRIIDRFDVKYPILITGYTANGDEPSQSLPMLNRVMAFPTTIIIDKKGEVRKIHTGFTGPGSGKYYEEFVMEFEKMISSLQQE
ncbi:TlpA disulfide reductase family protein [Pseudopedobacter beijingensis]|uniref:TlpA disulfide reductase family protein n=1 Tax=Pseudopedobacter beijingensis TaxID=1207056 RepID=A0ABW4IBN6_9SPHI